MDIQPPALDEPVINPDIAFRLNVTMVGMFALVMLRDVEGEAYGARFLFPSTEDERESLATDNVTIPQHVPLIGLVRDQHVVPPGANALFQTKLSLPIASETCNVKTVLRDVVFYDIRGAGVHISAHDVSDFSYNRDRIDPTTGPTCANSKSLGWLANMSKFARDSKVYTVAPRFMLRPVGDDTWSYAELQFGRLEVARIEITSKHRYKFIHTAQPGVYHQALADAVRIWSRARGYVTVQIGPDVDNVIRLLPSGGAVEIIMGSTSVQSMAHKGVVHREHCGVPAFHGELLYDFSVRSPRRGAAPVAVCTELHDYEKDPMLGRCIPPASMLAPLETVVAAASLAVATPPLLAISLHVGVNEYSQRFYNVNEVHPSSLNSCINDAGDTAALARRRKFAAVSGVTDGILADGDATSTRIWDAVQAADDALKASGGLFVLTLSCYGVPQSVRRGWCVYDRILFYDDLIARLSKFNASTRVLLVSDACFSGTSEGFVERVKELPARYAAALLELAGESARNATNASEDLSESVDDGADSVTIYHVVACGANETTPDGDVNTDSPFTAKLLYGLDSNVTTFGDLDLYLNSIATQTQHPALERNHDDVDFDKLGPLRKEA